MPYEITHSAANYWSYMTVALVDVYMQAATHGTTWAALSADAKARAVISATRTLDSYRWAGIKTVAGQPLEFPRTGLVDKNGVSLPSDTVPAAIEIATCELALILSQNTAVDSPANLGSGSNIKRLRAGKAEIEYFRPVPGVPIPLVVWNLVKWFWLGASAIVGGEASGVDQVSWFTDCAKYEKTTEIL